MRIYTYNTALYSLRTQTTFMFRVCMHVHTYIDVGDFLEKSVKNEEIIMNVGDGGDGASEKNAPTFML